MGKIERYYLELNDRFEAINCNDVFLEFAGSNAMANIESIFPKEDICIIKNEISTLEVGKNTPICFRMKGPDGKYSWMASNAHRSKHDASIIRFDIYNLSTAEQDTPEGYYDEMTGVLSKTAITDYAKKLMAQTPTRNFYFFIMDVDNFKGINDTYGHMKGDEVIVEVAHIAKECVGDKGLVGRIGGDEFALVLEKIHEEEELRNVLRDIRYNVREKYADEDNNFTITTSLGGALYPADASNYDAMFRLADKMLYIAKAKGRDRYIIYTPSVHGDWKDDAEVVTISQRTKQNQVKNMLIMDILEGFLLKDEISVCEAFKRVKDTYLLDEIYLIDKKTGKSTFGITKNNESISLDLSLLAPKDYQPLFENYPIKVINMYDLKKENHLKFSEFMIKNGFRIIITYYMRDVPGGAYLMYVSNIGSACRFAETDFSDLTYFSRILELSGKLSECDCSPK